MKITKDWLEKEYACSSGIKWFEEQKTVSLTALMKKAIAQKQFSFANWGLTKLMTQQQCVQYACFSALQSLTVFEKTYPTDKRPREAVLTALKWALDPSEENKSAAESAAWSAAESAAWSAAWSAARSAAQSAESAAWSAARSAAQSAARSAARSAAQSAESAARSAAESAESAESAAWSAARSAAESAESAESAARSAARSAAWKKILFYGLKIVVKRLVIKSVDHFLKGVL